MNRRMTMAAAGVLLAGASLTACGNSSSTAEPTVTASPIPATEALKADGGVVVSVQVTATSVSPAGATVSVGPGKPVTFRIEASVAGQLHVHSTPEQHIDFPVGTSKVTLTFTVPGIVVVEDHALDRQIVQIQVG